VPEPEDPIILYNLRVILFNWIPALGCLAVGITGLLIGFREYDRASTAGAQYLMASAAGFGLFGWVWRR
jgi:hypothetical protein